MSRSLPHRPRATALLPLAVLAAAALAACGGDRGASDAPSVDPTQAAWQAQLDELPTVDGADRTARQVTPTGLTETFTVPAGSPACLQVLARLDAGGYAVVAGAAADAVDPTTCRTPDPADGVTTDAGTATVLARGGSQIALTWTTTAYTVTASDT